MTAVWHVTRRGAHRLTDPDAIPPLMRWVIALAIVIGMATVIVVART